MAAVVVGVIWWQFGGSDSEHTSDDSTVPRDTSIVPRAVSRYENTNLAVEFVGSSACILCHAEENESFQRTAHARALQEVELATEPPDAEFRHAKSGLSYRVYRKGNRLWHKESIRADDGAELTLANYAMRYAIGSGRFSRSYLVEADGFLIESPVTWYSSRDEWAMSPGYDAPQHFGFERIADVGCLVCHVGNIGSKKGNSFRAVIHEGAVGCESCHGPGSLHVKRRTNEETVFDGPDYSIVHPKRLTRERREDVCANCHLRGEATSYLRGRNVGEFRPGIPLSDVRIDYRIDVDGAQMTVVGHVEQMRLSQCYIQSDSLTCTTCHNPHGQPSRDDREGHYRSTCLECHSEESCGLPAGGIRRTEVADYCVTCHMPTTDTDIPHFAFTHHRIAIHSRRATSEPRDTIGTLVPLCETAHLSDVERDRCLGLAYLEVSEKQQNDEIYGAYRRRAHDLLESVHDRGIIDADVEATLARLYWEQDSARAADFAHSALLAIPSRAKARVNALFILADLAIKAGDYSLAISRLRELVGLRRHSQDWFLLGMSLQRKGQTQGALDAYEHAITISPLRVDVRRAAFELYQISGHAGPAAKQLKAIEQLLQRRNR
jgi:hypothetical protein